MNMKTNRKKIWSWQPAGMMAMLLGAVMVLPVIAGISDSQSPTTNQTAIAHPTDTDTLVKVLPLTLVGAASGTNAEFIILRAKAEKGDAQAQVELGSAFFAATNYVEAVKWYRKAAEQNYAEAQFNLGYCYEDGLGVQKDEVEAVKWYHKAAELNLALAQLNLGSCYTHGQGVQKDEVEAVK